eukprot:jgi/Hompol1/3359/HPOL_006527-RA
MPTPEDSSPTNSVPSSDSSIIDPPGYIAPSAQDLLLTDIDERTLVSIAELLDVEYLGAAQFPGPFPVEGIVAGRNNRLMVNLVCQLSKGDPTSPVNIIFLIDTGSPVTYLSEKAIIALLPKDSNVPTKADYFDLICVLTQERLR